MPVTNGSSSQAGGGNTRQHSGALSASLPGPARPAPRSRPFVPSPSPSSPARSGSFRSPGCPHTTCSLQSSERPWTPRRSRGPPAQTHPKRRAAEQAGARGVRLNELAPCVSRHDPPRAPSPCRHSTHSGTALAVQHLPVQHLPAWLWWAARRRCTSRSLKCSAGLSTSPRGCQGRSIEHRCQQGPCTHQREQVQPLAHAASCWPCALHPRSLPPLPAAHLQAAPPAGKQPFQLEPLTPREFGAHIAALPRHSSQKAATPRKPRQAFVGHSQRSAAALPRRNMAVF